MGFDFGRIPHPRLPEDHADNRQAFRGQPDLQACMCSHVAARAGLHVPASAELACQSQGACLRPMRKALGAAACTW